MIQTEQALIGGLILMPEKLASIIASLSAGDFQSGEAKLCYMSICDLWKNGEAIDPITISHGDNDLMMYAAASTSVGTSFAVKQYAQEIANEAKRIRVHDKIREVQASTARTDDKLSQLREIYESEIYISKDYGIKNVLNRVSEKTRDYRKRGFSGFSTGFDFLQDVYIEFVEGQIWTIGGFTSSGKTAIMIQKIVNMLSGKQKPHITVVSTEMTEHQLVCRLVSNMTKIPSKIIEYGKYRNSSEEEAAGKCIDRLGRQNLTIIDDTYFLHEIEQIATIGMLKSKLDILFVDYVQNCRVKDAKTEYQSQSMMAKGLQALAKSAKCCIIALSQLSNAAGRGDSEQLELKGAGEWAAVSDVSVILKKGKKDEFELMYSVEKNRHGKRVKFVTEFKSDFTRIEEIEMLS